VMPRPRPAQVFARGVVGPLFRSLISRSRLPELTVPLRLGSYTLRFRPFTMGDLFVAAGIAKEGLYEPEVLRVFKPEAGDVFVDVGAHIGFYTLGAARLVGPSGKGSISSSQQGELLTSRESAGCSLQWRSLGRRWPSGRL
jgi:hypothetical protein